MPLWYVVRDGELWAWTFAKSQKVRNLERDPRATLQIEAGETYDQLRGVMFECEVEIDRDLETVTGVGMELGGALRRRRATPPPDDARRLRGPGRQARRVALRRAIAARRGTTASSRGILTPCAA